MFCFWVLMQNHSTQLVPTNGNCMDQNMQYNTGQSQVRVLTKPNNSVTRLYDSMMTANAQQNLTFRNSQRQTKSSQHIGILADIPWKCHAVWHWQFSLQFRTMSWLSRHSVAAVCADETRQPAVTVTGREVLSAEDCRDIPMLHNSVNRKLYVTFKPFENLNETNGLQWVTVLVWHVYTK